MLQIIDVLQYVQDNPNSTSSDISDAFDITRTDARVRLLKLKNSGQIRITKKEYPYEYEITEFGMRYLVYKRENPGKKKQWNAMMHKQKRNK